MFTCTLPHYLQPVRGVHIVDNGKKWKGRGKGQRKEEGPLYPHPLVIFFPNHFSLRTPGIGYTILIHFFKKSNLNWTKNQTNMKSLQALFKKYSNLTIAHDPLIWVLCLALCCSFSPPTVLVRMSSKSLTANWHANNFLPAICKNSDLF